MYGHFMLIGDRLVQRYEVDPTITSVPDKPRHPARTAAPTKRERR